ncbi:uncharacterized protein LOC123295258 isoform X2 [Chrysoperla carnea]|nr:uncharacterized protein LOC123295258 isoform X2 [Chrysoperla carnea]XP_044732467.1 uncharacterized protein LOC123295258 isoform X2 [Chrysoperla carnea]
MLERARLQSTNKTAVNPLENARIWGIPIWSVEKILNWLEKVAASILQKSDDLSTLKKKSKLKSTVKVEDLKPPFIKFEPYSRDARPIYKQLSAWPTINLDAEPGVSPFAVINKKDQNTNQQIVATKRTGAEKMIRKTRISLRSVKVDDTPPVQSGYCEICRVDYQDLPKHVRSDTHLSYVRDDANFLSLDTLITAGANVEAFLRLNGTAATGGKEDVTLNNCTMFNRRSLRKNLRNQIEIKINGDNQLTPPKKVPDKSSSTINNVRITRSSSACEKTIPDTIVAAPISPALSDGVHHLRSKKQLWLPSNLLGTTAEDEGNPVKPSKEDRVNDETDADETEDDDEQPLSKHLVKKTKTKKNSQKSSSTNRPKRPTADDRLLSENRAYYKVEVLSSKLRSSTTSVHKETKNNRARTPIIEEEETVNGDDVQVQRTSPPANDRLVVKFRRVRKSELSTLSNEAENFMFPRRDSSSENDDDEDCETDEERHTTGGFTSQDISSDVKSSDVEILSKSELTDEGSQDSQDCSVISSCDESVRSTDRGRGRGRKKRRRTHAEVFIQDNEKYYKFETPGSRLRFQGSFLPLMTGHHDIPGANTTIKTEQEVNEEKRKFESSLNSCNTAQNPMDQVTFTFERRSERLRDRIFANRVTQVERDFKLFIEMHCPKFIPLPLPYETNIPLMPRDPASCKEHLIKSIKALDQPPPTPPVAPQSDISETNHSEVNSNVDVLDVIHEDQVSNTSSKQSTTDKTKRKRRLLSPGKNPRKSPRQHASTLAILSGLLQQRSRRNTRESEGESLPPINEQNESSVSVCPSPIPQDTQETCKFSLDLDNLEANDEDFAEIDNLHIEYDSPEDSKTESEDHNFVHILNTYRDSKVLEIGTKEKWSKDCLKKSGLFQGNYSLFTPKEFRRKCRRKKNRTGWPNKRRVLSRRHFPGIPDEDSDATVGAVCDTTSDMFNNSLEPQPVEVRRRGRKRKNLIFNKSETERVDVESIENKENKTRAGTSRTVPGSETPIISPSRNPSRNPSSDCLGFTAEECAEVEKWGDNVDNILNAKIVESLSAIQKTSARAELKKSITDRRSSIEFQPYVKVQKIDSLEPLHQTKIENNRRLRSSSSSNHHQPKRKKMKIASASSSPPVSPRKLRKPRGRWYRDR